jgi:hypothetical protein
MTLNRKTLLGTLIAGLLLLVDARQARSSLPDIASFADGTYQVCSQPKPRDWQQGAGVCFVFVKQRDRVDGYYGYPHSDAFVCVRGTVKDDRVAGQAYIALWGSDRWDTIPKSASYWDEEQRLLLSDAKLIQYAGPRNENRIDWVRFGQATLNLEQFYRYRTAQMTPPTQLCTWQFN